MSRISHRAAIFGNGGGKIIGDRFEMPFLGSLPFDKTILEAGDNGAPFIKGFSNSKISTLFLAILEPILGTA